MKALLYLTKQSLINNLKKAVKKPLTLLILLFCAVYAVFLAIGLGTIVTQFQFDNAKGLVILLTVWSLYMFLLNFMAYASRKGILFRPAHAHYPDPRSMDELFEQCDLFCNFYTCRCHGISGQSVEDTAVCGYLHL